MLSIHDNQRQNPNKGTIILENNSIDGNGYAIYDDIAASIAGKADETQYFDLTWKDNVVAAGSTIDMKNGIKGDNIVPVSSYVDDVLEKSIEPITPSDNGNAIPTDKPSTDKAPKTGDDTNMAIWIALMAIATVAGTGTVLYRRKKHS